MAGVRKTPAGSWRAYWLEPSGKQVSKTFATKREATAFLGSVATSASTGAYVSPHAGRMLFGDHARAWMASWNTEATTHARDASIMRTHCIAPVGDVAARQDRSPVRPDLDLRPGPSAVARDGR